MLVCESFTLITPLHAVPFLIFQTSYFKEEKKLSTFTPELTMMEAKKLDLGKFAVTSTEPELGWQAEQSSAAAADAEGVPLTTVYNAVLDGKAVRILLDTGCSYNIISESFVAKHELKTVAGKAKTVSLGDGRRHTRCHVLRNAKLKMDKFKKTTILHF
jgi:hypothetical protein